MARILIAGCGDVGTALGLELAAMEHEVYGLKRAPATLPVEIQPFAADLTDPSTLGSLPAELDYVVYAAAAGDYSEARYQAAYVDGVGNLLAALQVQGQAVKRLLFVSSTSVYGQQNGEWVDENVPAKAMGFAAQCLRRGEQQAWQGPYSATVVRFAGIYGPGRTRLLNSVCDGTATYREGFYTNRIHRDDCTAVLAHLLFWPETDALYLGVDNEPALQCEVMNWLARKLGVPPPMARTRVVDGKRRRASGNKRCSNQRLLASGYQFRFPSYREGYDDLLKQSSGNF